MVRYQRGSSVSCNPGSTGGCCGGPGKEGHREAILEWKEALGNKRIGGVGSLLIVKIISRLTYSNSLVTSQRARS